MVGGQEGGGGASNGGGGGGHHRGRKGHHGGGGGGGEGTTEPLRISVHAYITKGYLPPSFHVVPSALKGPAALEREER